MVSRELAEAAFKLHNLYLRSPQVEVEAAPDHILIFVKRGTQPADIPPIPREVDGFLVVKRWADEEAKVDRGLPREGGMAHAAK